jgi:hypothetical protein
MYMCALLGGHSHGRSNEPAIRPHTFKHAQISGLKIACVVQA